MNAIPHGMEDPFTDTRLMLGLTDAQEFEPGIAPGGLHHKTRCSWEKWWEKSPCTDKRFVRPQERTEGMGDEASYTWGPVSPKTTQVPSTTTPTDRQIDSNLLRAYQIWTLSKRYSLNPRSFLLQEGGWKNVKIPDMGPTEEELEEFRRFMNIERRKRVSVWRKIYPP
jgi:hypothetical protein